MTRLFFILYSMGGTTLAGTGIVAALTSGFTDLRGVVVGAAIGAVAALPVCYAVARRLQG